LMSGQYSGVYVVEGWAGLYGEWQVLYVGQSADIGDRLRNHLEQKRKWFGFVGLPLYATDVDIDSRLRVRYCLALTQTDLDTIEGFVSRLLRPIYGERSPQFWIEG